MLYTFPSSKPTTIENSYTDGEQSMSFGMIVVPLMQITATALRWFAAAGVTARPRIWSRSGVLLASGPAVVCVAGWNKLPLAAPYEMQRGVDVTAGVFQTGGTSYAAKPNAYPIDSEVLVANYGKFNMGTDGISLAQSPYAAWYGVDLIVDVPEDVDPEPPVVPETPVGMDAIEIELHRQNTKAFIDYKPSTISLIPIDERVRTGGGGWKDVPGTPRAEQVFRIIELGMTVTPPVLKLQDGTERKQDFWLLAEWDAEVAKGDSWTSTDGRKWEIGDIVRPNGYEQRCLVAERGA